MSTPRRTGTETSETRARILDVTERIMLVDGYASVSSRSVAKEVGVTPALVHYYFATLDDLFRAVLRRRVDQQLERQARLLSSSDRPLHALWKLNSDPARTGLVLEFMSLANQRKEIRAELAAIATQFRQAQMDLLAEHVERTGLGGAGVSPLAVMVLLNHIAQGAVLEHNIGMDFGTTEVRALVEQLLDQFEGKESP
jgi:AcrR family transcriptional regulator